MSKQDDVQLSKLIEDKQRQKEEEELKNEFISNIDEYLEGIQVLREYMRFDRFGQVFLQQCRNRGTINETIQREKLRDILKMTHGQRFLFTSQNVEEILLEAPKEKNNKNQIVFNSLYQVIQLFFINLFEQFKQGIMEGPKPTTSYSMINHFMLKNHVSYDEARITLLKLKDNFFDTQEIFNFNDKKHYDLEKLDTKMLRNDWDKQIKVDAADEDDVEEKEKKDQYQQKQITESQKLNNKSILINIRIKFAKDILTALLQKNQTDRIQQIPDAQIEDMLHEAMRTKDKNNYILRQDLQEYLTSGSYQFNQIDRLKELTEEEVSLIYYCIWHDNNFAEFTVNTLAKFITANRKQNEQKLQPQKVSDKQKRRIKEDDRNLVPNLFQDIMKISFQFGLPFLLSVLKSFKTKDPAPYKNWVQLDNLKYFYEKMSIPYTLDEYNNLKYFFAEQRVIVLDNYQNDEFLNANMYMDLKALVKIINIEAQGISIQQANDSKRYQRNKEQVRNVLQARIIDGVLNRLLSKLEQKADENQMIDELTLREIVYEQFKEITSADLDLILQWLNNSTQPTKYITKRRIYLVDFMKFLRNGYIYEDQGTELQVQMTSKQSAVDMELEEGEDREEQDKNKENSQSNISNSQQNKKNQSKKQLSMQSEDVAQNYYDLVGHQIKEFYPERQARFITELETKAFKVNVLTDQIVLTEFYEICKKELLKPQMIIHLTQRQILDKTCIDLKALLKTKDRTQLGSVSQRDFEDIINFYFPKLGESKITYLVGIAVNACGVEGYNPDEKEIFYSGFCKIVYEFLYNLYFAAEDEKLQQQNEEDEEQEEGGDQYQQLIDY